MPRTFPLFFLLFVSFAAKSFTPDLSKWDNKQVSQARRAARGIFSTRRERDLVFYSNLARMNGPLFVQTILKPYLEETNDTAYSDYKQSLVVLLNGITKPRPALHYSMILNIMAKSYATKAGRRGYVGHIKIEKRFHIQRLLRHSYGENCSYGEQTGLDVAISLLIDEGMQGVGHRLNIMNSDFKRVGTGFAKHTKYGINAVMDFAGK